MSKILAIAQKELSISFKSPIAYIVLLAMVSVFNVFFFMILEHNREASLRDMFLLMEFMFIFLIPLLTMRTFSQEKETGTMEFLMTTPTTNTQIVLGKYLGSLYFYTFIIVLSFMYYFIINLFADPDNMALLVGYLGIWLEGALFIAIGLMTSSWTKNQILAAITSYAIIFTLYFSFSFILYLKGALQMILVYMTIMGHSGNFFSGIINTADLIYFFSGIIFCLVLTRLSIENRLWR